MWFCTAGVGAILAHVLLLFQGVLGCFSCRGAAALPGRPRDDKPLAARLPALLRARGRKGFLMSPGTATSPAPGAGCRRPLRLNPCSSSPAFSAHRCVLSNRRTLVTPSFS
nr:uncharacterized protein LOC119625235 [Chlorocebus sabaeus]